MAPRSFGDRTARFGFDGDETWIVQEKRLIQFGVRGRFGFTFHKLDPFQMIQELPFSGVMRGKVTARRSVFIGAASRVLRAKRVTRGTHGRQLSSASCASFERLLRGVQPGLGSGEVGFSAKLEALEFSLVLVLGLGLAATAGAA